MRARLLKLWESRSPRDRIVIGALAALVVALLYLALVQSAQRARTQLHASLQSLRAQAVRMDADINELARVRAAPPAPVPQSDLRTHLQAQAAAVGLSGAVVRMDARDADQVQIVFASVPYSDWLTWVASLQAQNIRLETGRIEALNAPGLVSITATFVRARLQ